MLHRLFQIVGLEQALQAVKHRLEAQAERLIRKGKTAATRAATVTALLIAAAISGLMAVGAGLVTLYLWLAPQVGSITASAIVAGILLGLAAILGLSAFILTRKWSPAASRAAPTAKRHETDFAKRAESRQRPAEFDSTFAPFALLAPLVPRTGVAMIDNILRSLTPKAEEATKEAMARAANVVRNGDRASMMGVLGSAVLLGWILSKTASKT